MAPAAFTELVGVLTRTSDVTAWMAGTSPAMTEMASIKRPCLSVAGTSPGMTVADILATHLGSNV
jgi:hypothetical protein